MPAVDISLNELTGAAPHEELTMQIGTPMSLFEFGNSGTDPISTIYPNSIASVAAVGLPSLLCAGFISPPGIPSTVQVGEPFLDGGGGTPINPMITNVAPVGENIGTQQKWSAKLSLATSSGAIIRIIINVEYPSGTSEEAFMDGAFTPDYSGASTIVQSSPGVFDIVMIRNGGWPSSPRIRLHANTDRGGMTQ